MNNFSLVGVCCTSPKTRKKSDNSVYAEMTISVKYDEIDCLVPITFKGRLVDYVRANCECGSLIAVSGRIYTHTSYNRSAKSFYAFPIFVADDVMTIDKSTVIKSPLKEAEMIMKSYKV